MSKEEKDINKRFENIWIEMGKLTNSIDRVEKALILLSVTIQPSCNRFPDYKTLLRATELMNSKQMTENLDELKTLVKSTIEEVDDE